MIEFIARKVVSNIRELEGALNRIVAYASMGAMPVSIELAQAVLSNVLYNPRSARSRRSGSRRPCPTTTAWGWSSCGARSAESIVVPRQIAMFLMREETDVSLLRIGAELGGRTTPPSCTRATRSRARCR